MRLDHLIRGDIVTPEAVLADGWIAVSGERIAAIGTGEAPEAAAVHAHRGRLVLPGLVDGHMHTSSHTGWEGIAGATRSAAAGGITTVCDMPYDTPRPVMDAEALAAKIEAVGRHAYIDVSLYATVRKSGGLDQIAPMASLGCTAFKLSTFEVDPVRFPRIDHGEMREAFQEIARTGRMAAIHNEDQEIVQRLIADAKASGRTGPEMHAATRPPLAERLANLAVFELGLATGCHVHLAHSSLAAGFDQAAAARAAGGRASAETCLHYLCMTKEALLAHPGIAKCTPPFRSEAEVEGSWAALLAGRVAYISTDHAPWPLSRKRFAGDIFAVGAGLTGLQTLAPLLYTLLERRGLPPTLIARFAAERPARFHGLWPKKGALVPGADADICILARGRFRFDAARIEDREEHRWSLWDGVEMSARVAETWSRGERVWDGERVLAAPGRGRFQPRLSDAPVEPGA
ncbi:MAG: amidohydrolase family protein [Acetobacteraceae bacterium]|nr:amidohydrolase family protein [Acetobacteraceae bacterium]